MKAAVYTRYGAPEVLQVKEVALPTPKDHEIRIRIKATAVNSGDVRLRKADPFAVRFIFGLLKPKVTILGSVFSGEVESIGKQVTRFKVGDEVFGHTNMRFGAYAEYLCMPEDGSIALKPSSITHPEAAVIPFGGVTALYFMKKVSIQPGQKVLIVGASGAVGSAAVQLALSKGAEVTGVCSTPNVALVKSLGAHKVIDYTQTDFTKGKEKYDVIFDTVNSISVAKGKHALANNGTMILSAAGMPEMMAGAWLSLTSGKKVLTGVTSHHAEDIRLLKELIEAGKYQAVIDKVYPMKQIAEAHAYVEKGHKRGNVAIGI